MTQAADGAIEIKNKAERINNIVQELSRMKSEKIIKASEAATLLGKLHFCEAQVFGRSLMPLLSDLRSKAFGGGAASLVDDDFVLAADLVADFLLNSRPRTLKISPTGSLPELVFTDGAVEQEQASCGAVIISRVNGTVKYFGTVIPEAVVSRWRSQGSGHAVAQAELLPVWLARKVFHEELCGSKAIYFIDNESVKETLIKGTSRSLASKRPSLPLL